MSEPATERTDLADLAVDQRYEGSAFQEDEIDPYRRGWGRGMRDAAERLAAALAPVVPAQPSTEEGCPLGKASCDPLANGCDGECES